MRVSRTYARLPFHDLSPDRFEDMCLGIIYGLQNWTDIQRYGVQGSDGGIDIHGEFIQDGILNRWVIQCKRHKTLSTKDVKHIIKDFKEKNDFIPDRYILMVSCDPSRKTHEQFKSHAIKAGIEEAVIYPAVRIETELYERHPNLLYIFFGISMNNRRSKTVASLKHCLSIKKKMLSNFKVSPDYPNPKVIIRDIHRNIYPNYDENSNSISPWFSLDFYRLYFNGISFVLRILDILYCLKTEEWRIQNYEEEPTEEWVSIKAFMIGNIPYYNIVDIDLIGDEYNDNPHFYCEFNNSGSPYEEIWYNPFPEYKNIVLKLDTEKCISFSKKKNKPNFTLHSL